MKLAPVLLLTLLVCAACDDPQGAYRFNRTFGLLLLIAAVLSVLFVVGAYHRGSK